MRRAKLNNIQIGYLILYLVSVFLASVSQVFLKKAALRTHKNTIAEYTDKYVILGYGLFLVCTMLTMIAYKGVPLSIGAMLETTGYVYVTIFGVLIFHEKINAKKIIALTLILAGIIIYAI